MTAPTISGALADPALLQPFFAGSSWATWKAVLRGAEGLRLNAADRRRFVAVAEREPPRKRVKELWCVVGRRGGKDSIASAIATIAALGDYRDKLRPGERAAVMCLACDRDQAKIIHRYIAGYFQSIPLLAPMVERDTADTIELTNGVEIIVATNSFRAVRGRTIVCAIFDEVAFWRSEDSTAPDVETYNAVAPGLATLGEAAMLIGISSPYRKAGLLHAKHRDCFGKDDPDVLVVKGATRMFNSTIPQRLVDEALARNPEVATAEWLGEFRSDIGTFLERELIDAAVDFGVVVRPAQAALRYIAFADPSGGRGDSFACAVAHEEGSVAVLDAIYERRAPFDPAAVVSEIAALLREYGVTEITGDRYAAGWVPEAFAGHGIAYQQSARDRSAIYADILPLFAAGRARLLDHPRLANQFASLERRSTRGGRDRIDHPSGGADDLANAAAGALTLVSAEAAPALIRARDFGTGAALVPRRVAGVMAVVTIAPTGAAGIIYFALPAPTHDAVLTILDFGPAALAPALFGQVAARLDELAEDIRSRAGGRNPIHVLFYAPRDFQPAALAAMRAVFARYAARPELRQVAAVAIEDDVAAVLLNDPLKLHFSAAGHVVAGRVRFSVEAVERSRSVPLMGALAATSGHNPLATALQLGAVLQFGRSGEPVESAVPAAQIRVA